MLGVDIRDACEIFGALHEDLICFEYCFLSSFVKTDTVLYLYFSVRHGMETMTPRLCAFHLILATEAVTKAS